jgi:hypothetical protein
MKIHRLFAAALASLFLWTAAFSAENAVLYWNQQALNATRLARNPPPMAAVFYAAHQVAIFDALNSVSREYQGWLVNEPAPAGINADAAVAGAAHTVMVALWSASSNPHNLETAYETALAKIPDGPAKVAGIAWGEEVGRRVMTRLAQSGYDKPIPGKYSSEEPGKWRETPAGFRPALLPYWGHVTPFVMTSAAQFRAPPPESLGSEAYAEELAFTAKVGARDNSTRTEYETLSAAFWADDLGTGTPAGHWNVVAHDVAVRHNLTELESARLFALLNLALADSGISCWETKYYYNTWRPVTALHEIKADDNAHAKADPNFIPTMETPPFPSYISGHSTFSGAAAEIMAKFFGTDDIEFTLTSDGLPGAARSYKSFSQACHEVMMSRVWGGIHTVSDNTVAQKVGQQIADWVLEHALQPLKATDKPAAAVASAPVN